MSIVIESVTLDDIKSYGEETTVDLGAGVTAILGDNGAGKSTIQEAVGYALFDSHPFSKQDRLVREGESSGEIAVMFTNRTSGAQYTVRRWAGRSKYEVLDGSGDNLSLDGTSEIKGWLCKQLGVDEPDDLSEVWERSVGVAQTDFLADFTKTETERIDTFDPLFDIERYREAYKSLGGLDEEFDGDIQDHRDEIIGLDARLEELPDVEERVEEHEATIAELADEIEALRGTIEELDSERERLEGVEDELDDAEQELATLEEMKIPAQEESLETAKEHRDEARTAGETLAAVREEYERHESAQERLDELEERRAERDEIDDERTDLGGEIDLLKHRVADAREDLSAAEAARERVHELEPEKERYEELQEEVSQLEDDAERRDEIEDELGDVDDEIEELRAEATALESSIEEAEAQREEAETLAARQDERQDLLAERKSLEAEHEELREQNEELRAIEIGGESAVSCPTCDQPVTADHRESVLERNHERIEALTEERLPAIEEEIAAVEERIEAAREAKEATDRIPQLEREHESVEEEIADLVAEKSEYEDERDELEGRLDELPDKREAVAELDGVAEQYHTAKATIESADGIEATLREARSDLGERLVAYRELDDELDEFDGLDREIETTKETIAETEEPHRTYIQHEPVAESLDERQAAVDEEGEALARLRAERKEAERRVVELDEAFDAARLDEIEEELSERKTTRARREQQRENREGDLAEARERLDELEAKRERKTALEAEMTELERDREFARWARDSLQQGAEDLRDLTTSEIGDRANDIYQALRAAPTETLVWDRTYNLRVRVRGQNKPFDTLSGGEKMAAALSVRLAILERLAAVGMAFLDEPTANLDEHKKRNLVDQLEEFDRLNQLLVVSHDRTFESMTERAIELEKDEDREMTRVVSD
ncbi:SMC family ATPase [Halococcus dombrowskii]|uniref:SMC family ATPase n=1 Tax=Halococcus dombrowskii TaxID=179637 RepID=A0AAV3SAV2_HALDO|nr:SMC family ATPase [Halococcus dombrowskii]UOO94289.1 SMC family ATPase [Halococcus dombrowskii]